MTLREFARLKAERNITLNLFIFRFIVTGLNPYSRVFALAFPVSLSLRPDWGLLEAQRRVHIGLLIGIIR